MDRVRSHFNRSYFATHGGGMDVRGAFFSDNGMRYCVAPGVIGVSQQGGEVVSLKYGFRGDDFYVETDGRKALIAVSEGPKCAGGGLAICFAPFGLGQFDTPYQNPGKLLTELFNKALRNESRSLRPMAEFCNWMLSVGASILVLQLKLD